MYVPFEEIPDYARVWIYQTDRPLSATETQHARQWGRQFVEQWAAHGQGLRASVTVLHHHFLVLALDEQHHAASGCSIDSSVGFVRALEEAFGKNQPLSFLDRTLVAFFWNDSVELIPLAEAKARIADGRITPDTLTFNNLIGTKEELKTHWQIAVRDSWLARYVPTQMEADSQE